MPIPFLVQERHTIECHGGIQTLYMLVGDSRQVPEFALSREMPPFQPTSDALVADRIRIQEARSQASDARSEKRVAEWEAKKAER